MLPYACSATILVVEPFSVALNHSSENRPLDATNQASILPLFRVVSGMPLLARKNLMINPGDNFFAPVHPLIPIPPYKGSIVAFLLKQFNTIMQFSHAFRNLFRGFRHSQICVGQRPGVKELFESSVGEGAEQTWTYVLAGKAA